LFTLSHRSSYALFEVANLIKKILAALDGSELAFKAQDLAVDIAHKFSAEVVLLSVTPSSLKSNDYIGAGMPFISDEAKNKYLKEFRTSHDMVLVKGLERAKKKYSRLQVSKMLVEGRPADKIIEVAKEGSFDLIVMGSRGLGELEKFFLGSVSHKVAHHADCPVLIVK
jgi:nucleotide-binding universal stress UspA family protein